MCIHFCSVLCSITNSKLSFIFIVFATSSLSIPINPFTSSFFPSQSSSRLLLAVETGSFEFCFDSLGITCVSMKSNNCTVKHAIGMIAIHSTSIPSKSCEGIISHSGNCCPIASYIARSLSTNLMPISFCSIFFLLCFFEI